LASVHVPILLSVGPLHLHPHARSPVVVKTV
jgi:hypothetical protein